MGRLRPISSDHKARCYLACDRAKTRQCPYRAHRPDTSCRPVSVIQRSALLHLTNTDAIRERGPAIAALLALPLEWRNAIGVIRRNQVWIELVGSSQVLEGIARLGIRSKLLLILTPGLIHE